MNSQQPKHKLKIGIYVPMGQCACDWQGFMDQVFEVLMPHLKEIDFDTKDSGSGEAKLRKLPSHCVVVGEEVFTAMQTLKNKLPSLIQNQ